MNIMKVVLILFIFVSCQQNGKIKIENNSISNLLEQSLQQDSLEFSEWKINDSNFLFFKAGNFLLENQKNALVIQSYNDSSYFLEFYVEQDNKWTKATFLDSISVNPMQFDLSFNDFNFDGNNDIYVQTNMSNGSGISSGIIFTQVNQKIEFNEVLSYLGNLRIDSKQKLIFSEEVVFCKSDGQKEICTTSYKWEKKTLKVIKVDCPCELEF